MKKLFAGCLILLAAVPWMLSFAARYYIQHVLPDRIAVDVEIRNFEFNHGWLKSTADADFYLSEYGLIVKTHNNIHHGPVIWKPQAVDKASPFALYRVETTFEVFSETDTQSGQSGTADTIVSFLGRFEPEIQHPGFNLGLTDNQVFADLPVFRGVFDSNGSVIGKFSGNQFEINNGYQNTYTTQPEIEFKLDNLSMPIHIRAKAAELTGLYGVQRLVARPVMFSYALEQTDQGYKLSSGSVADSLRINQAITNQSSIELIIDNLDPQLIEYFTENYSDLNYALQQSQWLVLLKQFSDLIKLINKHQPEFSVSIDGLHHKRKINIDFSGRFAADKQTKLNPFSGLETLDMSLNADIPVQFIDELDIPQISQAFDLLLEKGLLIKMNESYHARLQFQDARIKIAHSVE